MKGTFYNQLKVNLEPTEQTTNLLSVSLKYFLCLKFM